MSRWWQRGALLFAGALCFAGLLAAVGSEPAQAQDTTDLILTASFEPASVQAFEQTVLTYTIENTGTETATDVFFRDEIPGSLHALLGTFTSDCTGRTTPSDRFRDIVLRHGEIPPGASCQLSMTMVPHADDVGNPYLLNHKVKRAVKSSLGQSPDSFWSLAVSSAPDHMPPVASLRFGADSVRIRETVPMTLVIDNSQNSNNADLLRASFSSLQKVEVDRRNPKNTCRAEPEVSDDGERVALTDAAVLAGEICEINFLVTATEVFRGEVSFYGNFYTGSQGNEYEQLVAAIPIVTTPPTVAISLDRTEGRLGESVPLTIVIDNSASGVRAERVVLQFDWDGSAMKRRRVLSNDCPSLRPFQGTPHASVPKGTICTVVVEVAGERTGRYDLALGVFSNLGPTPSSNSVSLRVRGEMCGGKVPTDYVAEGVPFEGTQRWEVIVGTNGDDIIRARGGNDVICALGGDDQIDGGSGADYILAGRGSDLVRGGRGDDHIDAGEGVDHVDGQLGADFVLGGLGTDLLVGGTGNDVMLGGGGRDTIRGGADDDVLVGGPGADTLEGGAGNDRLAGHDGRDKLFGGPGNDHIDGGADNDQIEGGRDDDTILGNNGADTINAGAGDDVISGGNGLDTISGGSGDDSIDGGGAADTLNGDGGKDTIMGGGSDDVMDGGAGRDFCNGQSGDDTAVSCEVLIDCTYNQAVLGKCELPDPPP